MKRSDARTAIVRVYKYEYLKDPDAVNATGSSIGALPFYKWLEREHPELLDFRASGDKYQLVAGWILSSS